MKTKSKETRYPVTTISRLRMGTDGKGIRTLILLHGCPLRCKYCINPMTWNGNKEPRWLTAEDLYSEICIDRPYILATGGGITFGGGEPLQYPSLITGIRDICEPEMTINVETSLNVEWRFVREVIDVTDKFIIDIKTTDPSLYRAYTGGELSLAMENLKKLLIEKAAEDIIVRIPCIEGYVSRKKQEHSQKYLQDIGVKQFDLFDYKMQGLSNCVERKV